MNPELRHQSEETVNALTHAVALGMMIAGAPLLVMTTLDGTTLQVISTYAYLCTMACTFFMSTIYHTSQNLTSKMKYRSYDHASIYLAIVGCATPLIVNHSSALYAYISLSAIWLLALLGVFIKLKPVKHSEVFSVISYVTLGWLCFGLISASDSAISLPVVQWLLWGGIVYTAGIFFYALDHRRHFHGIWHIFVIIGAALHYVAIYKDMLEYI